MGLEIEHGHLQVWTEWSENISVATVSLVAMSEESEGIDVKSFHMQRERHVYRSGICKGDGKLRAPEWNRGEGGGRREAIQPRCTDCRAAPPRTGCKAMEYNKQEGE